MSGAAGNYNGTGGKVGVDLPSGGGEDNSAGSATSEAGQGGLAPSTGGMAGHGTTTGGAADAGSSVTAGSGGNAGTGGGSGGAPSGADLIDGFEDDDLTLEQTDGRGGVWFHVGDGTVGTVGPDPLVCSPNSGAPVNLGAFAMHVTSTGFTGSGSLLGTAFRASERVYDASRFTGIRFWAKVGVGKNTKHRVQIADGTTHRAGGKCNPAPLAPSGESCDDHFGINVTLTTSWAQYAVTFNQLKQLGWGYSAPALTKTSLYSLQVTAAAKLNVDLWLDEIEFF